MRIPRGRCRGVALIGKMSSALSRLQFYGLAQRSSRLWGRRWLAFNKSNDPIPFSKSGARTFRVVDDTLMQGERELRRSTYAVPLGLLSFAALVYLGFIRKETTSKFFSDKALLRQPDGAQKPAGITHDGVYPHSPGCECLF